MTHYWPVHEAVPEQVLAAYGWLDSELRLVSNSINLTFLVVRRAEPVAVLQRVHAVFGADIHADIEAVTNRLAAKGVATSRLLATEGGGLYVLDADGRVWRAQSYLFGQTLHRVDTPERARSAAQLVARFHAALRDFDYEFKFARSGVHDTASHLRALKRALGRPAPVSGVGQTGREILELAEELDLEALERQQIRICHGDLKISNVLFDPSDGSAKALIDLDTVGGQSLAYELGDAMRSWCSSNVEEAPETIFRQELFAAAMQGYASAAPALERAEVASIVPGLHAVTLELAARFCRDAVEECYFGWDQTKYSRAAQHHLLRARSQLRLARSVRDLLPGLQEVAMRAFSA